MNSKGEVMKKIKTLAYAELGHRISQSLFFHNKLKQLLFQTGLNSCEKPTSIKQKYVYIAKYFYNLYVHEEPNGIRIVAELCVNWEDLVQIYKKSTETLSHFAKRKIGFDDIEDWIHCITHVEINERHIQKDIHFTMEPAVFECPEECLKKLQAITRDIHKQAQQEAYIYNRKYNDRRRNKLKNLT